MCGIDEVPLLEVVGSKQMSGTNEVQWKVLITLSISFVNVGSKP